MKVKLSQLLFKISVMGSNRLQDSLQIKYGYRFSWLITSLIKIIALKIPPFFVKFFPATVSAIMVSSILRYSENIDRFKLWITQISESNKYTKFYIHCVAKFTLIHDSIEQSEQFINSFQSESGSVELIYANQWAFFNLNQVRYTNFLIKSKTILEKTEFEDGLVRYLPEHTKHMGHLGNLFLYGNYYGKVDPNRTVAIWPHFSPNKFYLNELLKTFPLKVKIMSQMDRVDNIHHGLVDTLMLSKERKNLWRFEPIAAPGTNQIFPEYVIDNSARMKSNFEIEKKAINILKNMGFNSEKWFIVLHIKESKIGYRVSREARDSNIEDYRIGCRLIQDLGGQVVRMGNSSFPKLTNSYPAIDYANAPAQIDFVDYWLWANCKFWVGNVNGAASAVVPFGKQRLITNQWPYDANGPSDDVILPKIAYNEKLRRILTFNETVLTESGRTQNLEIIRNSGISLIDNSPELIKSSILELVESNLLTEPNVKLENDFYYATKVSTESPKMRFSKAFIKFYNKHNNN